MMYGSWTWPVLGVVGVLFAIAMWKHIRSLTPLKCPACGAVPEWTGSGSHIEPDVEYRLYKCRCGAHLVKESEGPLQRKDDWVPGRKPQAPPKARVQ